MEKSPEIDLERVEFSGDGQPRRAMEGGREQTARDLSGNVERLRLSQQKLWTDLRPGCLRTAHPRPRQPLRNRPDIPDLAASGRLRSTVIALRDQSGPDPLPSPAASVFVLTQYHLGFNSHSACQRVCRNSIRCMPLALPSYIRIPGPLSTKIELKVAA